MAQYVVDESKNEISDFHKSENQAVIESLPARWQDKQYTDLEVTCQIYRWPLHKVVVCGQSRFFQNACKETFLEGQTNKISFPDDEPDVVNAMLYFFYNRTYPHPKDESALLFHLRVYVLADKYEVSDLADLACRSFHGELGECCDSDVYLTAIRTVYSMPIIQSQRLREEIIDAIDDHDDDDSRQLNFLMDFEKPGFRKLMAEFSDFSIDLAVCFAQGKTEARKSQVEHHSTT